MTHEEQMPITGEMALAVLEKCPLGILITDAGPDEPIVYANPAFCALTGYAVTELLGRSPRFLQGPNTDRTVLDRLRVALQEGKDFEGETWNYRRDGSAFVMQWTVSPMCAVSTSRSYLFAMQRDVTELRRLEQIAEAANLMDNLGYVFAGLRHELGNPINSIKAALTLLRRGVETYTRERLGSRLDSILEELRRVEYLLAELRTFNAYEGATMTTADVEEYLRRFLGLIAEDCRARNCTVELTLAKGAPRYAVIDRRGLHQVLLNLIVNAMDAGAADGEGGVSVHVLVRAGLHGGCDVVIADDGPGIREVDLPRVFMPFFTTKASGTGLGLPLVQRILARMNASISAHSAPGEGATFVVSLPLPRQVP